MTQWKTLCKVTDIPKLGARKVRRATGIDLALFRTAADGVFALLDRCPHKGGPLSQGIVFGESVACPLHNWTIGLADGCATAPDVGCTQKFSVRIEEGVVSLDLDELNASADATPDATAAPSGVDAKTNALASSGSGAGVIADANVEGSAEVVAEATAVANAVATPAVTAVT